MTMESTKALNAKALARRLAALHEHLQDQPLTFADSTDMETLRQASSFLTALSAQGEAAQPAAEGWALVPREPTKEMIEAGRLAANRVFTDLGFTDPDDERIGTQAHNRKCARACYIAAIAASPNAASLERERALERERDELLEELGRVIMACPQKHRTRPADIGVRSFREAAEAEVKLLRAATIEECAKVADEAREMRERLFNENGASLNASKAAQAEAIAAAIRALADANTQGGDNAAD